MLLKKVPAVLLSSTLVLTLNACSSDSNDATEVPALTGTVYAPGGAVAFNPPGTLEKMFAGVLGNSAVAAISGVSDVGAGVDIALIEIDANGDQVGVPLAETTTEAGGVYSIVEPTGFMPGPRYVIRAAGNAGNMDARVTGVTNDVDPLSDATSDIITTNITDLTALTAGEVEEIADAGDALAQNVDPTGLDSQQLSAAFVTEAGASEEFNNILGSATAAGEICGTVTDSNGTALENVRIVVRDYGNWVTRAKAKTDATGHYCVNVPPAGTADPYIATNTLSGEYILGAINRTAASMAASQWWTSTSTTADGSGGANSQFGSDKISVADTTTLTRDFVLLANGSRIEGTVTNSVDGGAMEGMKVLIRNYDTFKPLSSARVKADGSYRINVKPGDYLLSFRNKTRLPYASEIYRSSTDGVNNRNMASRETMVAGTVHTYNAVMEPGVAIAGKVAQSDGTAIAGQVVTIANKDGGRIERLRTNKEGNFRLVVNPRLSADGLLPVPYQVQSRGQRLDVDTNGADNLTATGKTDVLLQADVAEITGKLVAADGTAPVAEAVLQLRVAGTAASGYGSVNLEVSNSDGTFRLYTDALGDYVVQVRLDSDLTYGSGNHMLTGGVGDVGFGSALATTVAGFTTIPLGELMLPTLGVTPGVGYLDGNAGAGAASVSICTTGTTACGKGGRLVSSNARGDGSFKISLPVGTYPVIRSSANGASYDCTTAVTIVDGQTSSITFDLGGTGACSVTNP